MVGTEHLEHFDFHCGHKFLQIFSAYTQKKAGQTGSGQTVHVLIDELSH